jgi:hypothetical protein
VLSLTGHEAGESTYVCFLIWKGLQTPPPCAPRGAGTVSATMWSTDLREMHSVLVFCVDVCVYAFVDASFEQVV